jgi:hypothetical protein
MRAEPILAMLLSAALLAGCGKGRQEERERIAREQQAQKELLRKQQESADAMRAQVEQRFAQSMNCDVVIRNRQVLHEAMERGGAVFSMGGGTPAPKTPADMRAAFDEAQTYIDQNCAEVVAAYRRPGGHCTFPQSAKELVCR